MEGGVGLTNNKTTQATPSLLEGCVGRKSPAKGITTVEGQFLSLYLCQGKFLSPPSSDKTRPQFA